MERASVLFAAHTHPQNLSTFSMPFFRSTLTQMVFIDMTAKLHTRNLHASQRHADGDTEKK